MDQLPKLAAGLGLAASPTEDLQDLHRRVLRFVHDRVWDELERSDRRLLANIKQQWGAWFVKVTRGPIAHAVGWHVARAARTGRKRSLVRRARRTVCRYLRAALRHAGWLREPRLPEFRRQYGPRLARALRAAGRSESEVELVVPGVWWIVEHLKYLPAPATFAVEAGAPWFYDGYLEELADALLADVLVDGIHHGGTGRSLRLLRLTEGEPDCRPMGMPLSDVMRWVAAVALARRSAKSRRRILLWLRLVDIHGVVEATKQVAELLVQGADDEQQLAREINLVQQVLKRFRKACRVLLAQFQEPVFAGREVETEDCRRLRRDARRTAPTAFVALFARGAPPARHWAVCGPCQNHVVQWLDALEENPAWARLLAQAEIAAFALRANPERIGPFALGLMTESDQALLTAWLRRDPDFDLFLQRPAVAGGGPDRFHLVLLRFSIVATLAEEQGAS